MSLLRSSIGHTSGGGRGGGGGGGGALGFILGRATRVAPARKRETSYGTLPAVKRFMMSRNEQLMGVGMRHQYAWC